MNIVDKYGNNAINLCTINNFDYSFFRRLACIEILLSLKVDINRRTVQLLWYPINWCILNGDALSVKRLIEAGAEICYPDKYGNYLVDYAGKFVSFIIILTNRITDILSKSC